MRASDLLAMAEMGAMLRRQNIRRTTRTYFPRWTGGELLSVEFAPRCGRSKRRLAVRRRRAVQTGQHMTVPEGLPQRNM